MADNTRKLYIALIFRISALILSLSGAVAHTGIFSGKVNKGIFLTYTLQSNIFVCGAFLVLIFMTYRLIKDPSCEKLPRYASVISFAAMTDIVLTMLIFWAVLVPGGNYPGENGLFSFDNLMVHLITPLLIISDRIIFAGQWDMKKRDIVYVTVFPYIYVLQAYLNGRLKIISFHSPKGESYYLYPFLDFERLGMKTFVYIFILTVFFILLSMIFYRWEQKRSRS